MDLWTSVLLAAASCAVPFSAWAETNFYAHASVAETNLFMGQVFHVDVIVKAPAMPDAPEPASPDFNITLRDSGPAAAQTNTWLYRYAFRAKREGKLHIPVLHFEALHTQPIAIQANKPQTSDRMRLNTAVSKTSVYLGEPVLLTTTWDSTYQLGALKAVDFHYPIMTDKRFQILELYEPDKEQKAQTTGLPVHGTRVLATRKNYQVDGIQHQSLSFSKILIPKKSGAQIIPPSTLLCAAEQEQAAHSKQARRSAFQYPAYFDNTFFDQNVTGKGYTRIYTESAPITLEVKPLPRAGRPALFNGMVGDYSIAVAAEPQNVRVGDPVTLTITITAAEFLETIFFEPLRYQTNLVNRFEIPSDRSLPQRTGKSKIYTQTIRPLSTTISNVPPLQLAYFSPRSNAYVTVQSAPIPLNVAAGESITAFGMKGALHPSRLRTVAEGIRHNYEGPDLLKKRRPPLFGWAHPAAVISVVFLPPLLVGGLCLAALLGEKKRHLQRTAKAARAFKAYRKNAAHIIRAHHTKSEIYRNLDGVLRAYLGDRLHLNPGALTFRDAEALLSQEGASAQTLDELRALFTLCEAYRFTAGYDEPAEARKIIRNATRIVKAVERSLK